MNKDKTGNITNFIGVYDNYITKEECDRAIELFEKENKMKRTMNRKEFENSSNLEKKDTQFFATCENLNIWHDKLKTLIVNYNLAFNN